MSDDTSVGIAKIQESVQLEIVELDDLSLSGVAGGSAINENCDHPRPGDTNMNCGQTCGSQ